jgi:hypothetical protein
MLGSSSAAAAGAYDGVSLYNAHLHGPYNGGGGGGKNISGSAFSGIMGNNFDSAETRVITLKILSANEAYPVRTLILPANIGRVADHRLRPSGRNGLLNSRFLSRHHAAIKVENRRVVVEDLGSCNGTFVNGVIVKAGESWPVADGDILQFGSEDDDANSKRSLIFFWRLIFFGRCSDRGPSADGTGW